jgi:LysM repeat protein
MSKVIERNKRLIKDYLSGYTIKKLTDKYGLKYTEVKGILEYNNIFIKQGGRVKLETKISDLMKIQNLILEYFNQGETISSLSVRFNASMNQIIKVLKIGTNKCRDEVNNHSCSNLMQA